MRLAGKSAARILVAGTLSWAVAAVAQPDSERLLSPAELAAMEREDGMWRQLRVEEDMPACLHRLGAAGYTEAEISAFQPRLAEVWEPTAERNFGWLPEDTVEKIRAVDREFIARVRAVRLRVTAGLVVGRFPPTDEQTLNRLWRQALLRLLDYDEIAEFRLMNSAAAREAGRLLQGIEVTPGEQRMLFQAERDFVRTYGATPYDSGTGWQLRAEAQLDHFAAVREVLGSDRFALYLERAAPDFAQMREALAGLPPVSAGALLDLWWLRKKQEQAAWKKRFMTAREWRSQMAATRDTAEKLLGEARFAAYLHGEDARWLNQR